MGGTAALVAPHGIPFAQGFVTDGIISIAAILMFMAFINLKNYTLRKTGAAVMLVSYIAYLIYIL